MNPMTGHVTRNIPIQMVPMAGDLRNAPPGRTRALAQNGSSDRARDKNGSNDRSRDKDSSNDRPRDQNGSNENGSNGR